MVKKYNPDLSEDLSESTEIEINTQTADSEIVEPTDEAKDPVTELRERFDRLCDHFGLKI